eukprot:scpid36740/ scgid18492/ Pre-mRNA-splicing factor SYF1; Protein HCNP; XPA-binding protein 2
MPDVDVHSITLEEDDIPFEEDIIRNPYHLKSWLRYIEHKVGRKAPRQAVNLIYERAVKELPGSYKLWYAYLKRRRLHAKSKVIVDPEFEKVNNAFERCLVFLHKMPRIWLDYCQFLMDQRQVTRTRHTLDRALRSLALTQHDRVWPLYLKFVRSYDIPDTGMRVYRRYLKFFPENGEDFVDYLKSINRLDQAALKLADLLNEEKFTSKHGKSHYQLWKELCSLMSENPDKVKDLKVENIIRCGLDRFTNEAGALWCALAQYHSRSGQFEKARDVYEEAISKVMTARDFGQVFDAYAQFEETMIEGKMSAASEFEADEEDDIDIELRMARFERLMERRPLLLNSVLLRQNPHNVHEWHKRVSLFDGKPKEIINTYAEAVRTVNPKQATGKLHTLWVAFAKFYESNKQLNEARSIFKMAVQVPFRNVEELATVWCEYAEMEVRAEDYERARQVMREATATPKERAAYHDASAPVQNRVFRSLKLWSMHCDLEESLGTFQTTKAVYNRILDLGISSPQIIINFAMFLEESNYFEDAFTIYERGVSMFKWPNVFDIWNTYLTKFLERYGGRKLERARDLFEQCLDGCPDKFAKNIYLLYAKMEEEHGMGRHAMSVYERATSAVLPAEQFEMFNIYIQRAASIFGVTHTRQIYEKAIEVLPDTGARKMCVRFAQLECKLGEFDRARAVFMHGSQLADPRLSADYWKHWQEFEVAHGNEDSYRELLRIKRSVQAQYNTSVNYMSAQMLAAAGQAEQVPTTAAADSMKALEAQAKAVAEQAKEEVVTKNKLLFVRSTEKEIVEATKEENPDEILLGDDDDDDDDEQNEAQKPKVVELAQQPVPSEVFGKLARDEDS